MDIFDSNVKLRIAELMKDVVPEMTPTMKAYAKLYRCWDRATIEPVKTTIESMKKQGIAKAILRSANDDENEIVYGYCQKYPDMFYGFAGIHVHKVGATQGLKNLKKAYDDYSFDGLSLGPMFTGIYINDKRNYPLFAETDSRGKIMVAHTALHYNPGLPYDLGDPKYLDQIAVDFPNMKIVVGHAGQGFSTLGASLAHRHKNVYLDFSALAPEIVRPETIFAANTYLRKKCLFGTSYPLVDFDVVERWKKIIAQSNHQLFFYDNLAKLMGIIE